MMELGDAANENRPRLRAFDRSGERIDEVDYHPSYHRLMQLGMRHGVHSFAWQHRDQAGAHVARAALFFMHYQAESGTCCPLTMTHAVVPALQRNPGLAAQWLPRVASAEYDPRSVPAAAKRGCTMGMGRRKQGGSDVRANTTRARRPATAATRSSATSGSLGADERAWLVLRRRMRGSPASCCRAGISTARATPFACSV